MKHVRFALGLVLLALAFPIACFVAFRRGRRQSIDNRKWLNAYVAATRPLYGRR